MATEAHELHLERHIAAPLDVVWRMMTERLDQWFCPRPWRAEVQELQWRAGGRSAIVMHGPGGEAMLNEGVVLAFEPGRRFVLTDAFTGDWLPSGPFMVGIFAVEPDGTGTRYTATARHWTADAAERHRTMGFEAGWGAAADQLKALAEAEA